jgi:release factor glutamine methyltransferase
MESKMEHLPDLAWVSLGRELRRLGYEFVTPTPETHRRVLGREPGRMARDLRDVFGWSRPFEEGAIPAPLHELLDQGGALEKVKTAVFRSKIRFSTLDSGLFVHSAFPTVEEDAVFFGPDTYRFVSFLKRAEIHGGRVVDLGAGSGAGGLSILSQIEQLVLSDVNPAALRMAHANARLAGAAVESVSFVRGAGLDAVVGEIDCVIANPPFLVDGGGRAYRHGGEMLGAEISVDWARQSLQRLKPGGRLVMYTASAIQNGQDPLKIELARLAKESKATLDYAEIDPDIFGEELARPEYSRVERIAAVGIIICSKE